MCIICNLGVRIIDDLGGRCARRKYVLWPKRTKKDDFLSFTCYMYMYITCDFVDFLSFTRRETLRVRVNLSIVIFAQRCCPSVSQSVSQLICLSIYSYLLTHVSFVSSEIFLFKFYDAYLFFSPFSLPLLFSCFPK